MKNKVLKLITTAFCSVIFSFSADAQELSVPSNSKLVYTIHVDGLVSMDQATRLENSFKLKTGIISDNINFETKTITVKTTDEITYLQVCDILSTEGLKSQNYIVTKE